MADNQHDHQTSGTASQTQRIGPNAIWRVAEAMRAGPDADATARVFECAGLSHYLETLPQEMVDEREVTALHQALREVLGVKRAREIGADAGRRTGDYLLAKRIPRPAQAVLKVMPRSMAARILLKAIEKNAWTFAGGARFSTQAGTPTRFILEGSRVCLGAESPVTLCDYYGGTFERLWRVLVDPHIRVVEVQCQAMGKPACIFEVRRDAS